MKILGTYIADTKIYKNGKLIRFGEVNMIKFKADGFIFDMQINLCKPLNK